MCFVHSSQITVCPLVLHAAEKPRGASRVLHNENRKAIQHLLAAIRWKRTVGVEGQTQWFLSVTQEQNLFFFSPFKFKLPYCASAGAAASKQDKCPAPPFAASRQSPSGGKSTAFLLGAAGRPTGRLSGQRRKTPQRVLRQPSAT